MQEVQVQSVGREDPLGKEMATPSSILAWKNPTEEPGGLQCTGSQKSWTRFCALAVGHGHWSACAQLLRSMWDLSLLTRD